MTLPIILGVLALALGLLSALLTLLVGKRYHEINRSNSSRLKNLDEQVSSHATLHRSHTRATTNLDAEFAMCRSQIAQLNTSTGGFWRMATGVLLQIRQMSTDHILACIEHLKERGNGSVDTMKLLTAELRRRRYDQRMSARTASQVSREFAEALRRSPCVAIEAKDTVKVQVPEPKTSFVVPPANYPAGTPSATRGNRLQREVADLVDHYDAQGKPGDLRGPMDGRIFENLRSALAESFERKCMPAPDYVQIDRIVTDLLSRTVASRRINDDLAKLAHLLQRGRKA